MEAVKKLEERLGNGRRARTLEFFNNNRWINYEFVQGDVAWLEP